MTSEPGKQTIAIHILPNFSRSKGNQTMRFGQLIKYNTRNVFLEESFKICDRETIPWPFSKKSKLSISLDRQSEVFYSLILLYVQIESYQNILNIRCRPIAFTSYQPFFKNRKKSGTSLSVSFSAWFLKKNISWPNFIVWLPLLHEILGNMYIEIVC